MMDEASLLIHVVMKPTNSRLRVRSSMELFQSSRGQSANSVADEDYVRHSINASWRLASLSIESNLLLHESMEHWLVTTALGLAHRRP
jgi:hypothetical protein